MYTGFLDLGVLCKEKQFVIRKGYLFQDYIVKRHNIYWEWPDSVKDMKRGRGKVKNLAIFTDFSIKGEFV